MRDHEPAETDRGHQLQLDVLLPGGVADLLEAGRRRGARVVHEDVDAAPAREGRRDERLDLLGPRHVGGHRQHVGAGLAPDLVGDALEQLLASRAGRHAGARAREALDAGAPEAVVAARDDHDLVLEAELECVHGPRRYHRRPGRCSLSP